MPAYIERNLNFNRKWPALAMTNQRAVMVKFSVNALSLVAICMVVLTVPTAPLKAQPVPSQPPATQTAPAARLKPMAFDVVSIRKSQSGGASNAGATPDGYHAANVPILSLVATAFAPGTGLSPYFEYTRVIGAPDWTKEEFYNIEAKVAESDLTEWQKPDSQKAMLRSMLQTFLAERCKLVVHREMKETSVYELVTTAKGPKLTDATSADDTDLRIKHPGGIPLPGGGILINGDGQMKFFGISTATFAEMLSTPAGRPVQDKTGLQGRYDFVLQLRDQGPVMDSGRAPDPALSIFTVMQEQLGLRLQPAKGQVEMLVIDHMERPSGD